MNLEGDCFVFVDSKWAHTVTHLVPTNKISFRL